LLKKLQAGIEIAFVSAGLIQLHEEFCLVEEGGGGGELCWAIGKEQKIRAARGLEKHQPDLYLYTHSLPMSLSRHKISPLHSE